MSNPLAENVVRAVVREWMSSKSPIMDRLLEAVADQLVPIAREQALQYLAARIIPDAKDSLLDECMLALNGQFHGMQILLHERTFKVNCYAEWELLQKKHEMLGRLIASVNQRRELLPRNDLEDPPIPF